MADAIGIKVRKTGFFRPPVLDNSVLTWMGTRMVREQKKRWAASITANGAKAAPLSKPYMYRKAKIRRTNRPVRDLNLTGLLLDNFTLRKAANGIIRAAPTSRKGVEHAKSANAKDQMIGFSGEELKTIYTYAGIAYGSKAKKMWVPVG